MNPPQWTSNLIIVDCEGGPAVGVGEGLREFGAAHFIPEPPCFDAVFQGTNSSRETFVEFALWLESTVKGQPVFVSDNPAYDWQFINHHFWIHLGRNPFGHSARRISDFYAGLVGDFRKTQQWKRLRITKHDHHPVHDAIGNCEAFGRILKGER